MTKDDHEGMLRPSQRRIFPAPKTIDGDCQSQSGIKKHLEIFSARAVARRMCSRTCCSTMIERKL